MKPCDLAGLSVLVTRPEQQSIELCELIAEARGRPVRFPALEILGPADKQQVRRQLAELGDIDLLVFVSTNAVRYAFAQMPENIPLDLQIAAVGEATARALDELGLEPTLQAQGSMDSEGLLRLPQLQQMTGKRVLIVRGNGGRELLRETLGERGARVDYVEVYRRRIPQRNPANLLRNWSTLVEAVTVTSGQILDNLFEMLGEPGEPLLHDTPLVVVSRRIAAQAQARGCRQVLVAASAADRDVLKTLCQVAQRL